MHCFLHGDAVGNYTCVLTVDATVERTATAGPTRNRLPVETQHGHMSTGSKIFGHENQRETESGFYSSQPIHHDETIACRCDLSRVYQKKGCGWSAV
jgi:hypothetical protein